VAIAYHAREHGLSDRPEFVLVRGTARTQNEPDREWLESITPQWDRFLGPRECGLWQRWMSVYYRKRVATEVEISRIVVWAEISCADPPEVLGEPLPPGPPAAQKGPANGTGPRLRIRRAAAGRGGCRTRWSWAGADGLPTLLAAGVTMLTSEVCACAFRAACPQAADAQG
jgi:hypothetical protein